MSSPKPARVRADVLLEQRGLAESRARAQASILAGEVFLDEQRIEKPGQLVDERAARLDGLQARVTLVRLAAVLAA